MKTIKIVKDFSYLELKNTAVTADDGDKIRSLLLVVNSPLAKLFRSNVSP